MRRERTDRPERKKRNRRGETQADQPSQPKAQNETPQPPVEQTRKRTPNKPERERSSSAEDDYSRMEFETTGSGKPMTSDIPAPPRLARPPRKPRQPIDPQAAADVMRGLNAPVEKVKGVGPKMATLLNKLGIFTINDLLFFLPRRYDDYTQLACISHLQRA